MTEIFHFPDRNYMVELYTLLSVWKDLVVRVGPSSGRRDHIDFAASLSTMYLSGSLFFRPHAIASND